MAGHGFFAQQFAEMVRPRSASRRVLTNTSVLRCWAINSVSRV